MDLMHEFELGVFRDFLIHLLRLLYACGVETIAEFDHRFRMLAARDFEDILQCIIPVFEGLLPQKHKKHKKDILNTLFLLTTWQAYTKLRLHTDHTLNSFEQLTRPLGEKIQLFAGKITKNFV
ncbi:hypothetical protein BDM02DRAFT_3184431, partial [Thelephora ganbajun]